MGFPDILYIQLIHLTKDQLIHQYNRFFIKI